MNVQKEGWKEYRGQEIKKKKGKYRRTKKNGKQRKPERNCERKRKKEKERTTIEEMKDGR